MVLDIVVVYAVWTTCDWIVGKPFDESLLMFSVILCLVGLLNKQILNRKG